MRIKSFFFLFLLMSASVSAFAQDTLSKVFTLNWSSFDIKNTDAVSLRDIIHVKNDVVYYTPEGNPVITFNIPLKNGQVPESISLDSVVTLKLDAESYPSLSTELLSTNEFKTSFFVHSSRKEKIAEVIIEAAAYFPGENRIEILESFSLKLITQKSIGEPSALKNLNVKQNSVLANGEWYKFRLSKSGIYKISYQDLSSMGIDVDKIDPRKISIYGNGGGMLPEDNSIAVYDDLVENAVYVHGEEDGSFDQNDYILFYGDAPTQWTYHPLVSSYRHNTNIYSDHTYYFITIGSSPGKRIETQYSQNGAADKTVNTYDAYAVHEVDEVNLVGTGRHWYQRISGNKLNLNFETPHLKTSAEVKVRARVAARSYTAGSFRLTSGGEQFGNVYMAPVSVGQYSSYADERLYSGSFLSGQKNLKIEVEYVPTSSQSMSWLDYLEVNYTADLKFTGAQFEFRNHTTVAPGNITEFRILQSPGGTRVWNISDPLNVKQVAGKLEGSEYVFKLETDSLLEFAAFTGTSYQAVEFVEKVENQNLHALPTPDYVIVSHPDFYQQALRLAEHHRTRNQMTVHVVKTGQVYNEFSGGGKDITGIRNFMRMFYNRNDGDKLKYLLLFGDASYDYKDRTDNNSDFVPSWETTASLKLTTSFVTDDYYGLLDSDEGNSGDSMLGKIDLGIGRLPVSTVKQAENAVDKILHYTGKSDEVRRPWRNTVCFIADDGDNNIHFNDAEKLSSYVENNIRDINIEKIYLDAYPQESTPSGQRYPGVREDLNKAVEKGALVVNYSGHGGELGLAHEQILGISDVNSWKNFDNLAVFITATCEFSRYDDPTRISAGELVFLNPAGGAIAMFTTTRATYANDNYNLNKKFYEFGFKKINGEYPSLGDVLRLSKTALTSVTNKRKYALLGDPALKLAYPHDSVVTTKINEYQISEIPDTLKALAKVSIEGSLYDCNGNMLTDFNGTIFPTVYDKETKATTFGQDEDSKPANFKVRKNIVYKGKAPVVNGNFEFSFIVPKDIAYNYGFGRISYYARSEKTDATGYFEDFIVGGFEKGILPDTVGPRISLFINDTNFVNGGVTDENPQLLAFFKDESGINTVGNGIGHDITAVLNDKKTEPYILNEYYESDLADYTSGSLRYPLFELNEGKHVLDLKVWDVYNNSSDSSISFVVVNGSEFIIEDLINYPNPMQYETNFVFEHNQPGIELDIEIQIFNINGKLERSIKRNNVSSGYRTTPIKWDGTGNTGEKLSTGFYIYRLIARDSNGVTAEQNGKLILVNP